MSRSIAIILGSILFLIPPARAGGESKTSFELDGTTAKGTIRVPRGQAVLVKYRSSAEGWDRAVMHLSVPGDFPTEACTVSFDYTVLVDAHGLGIGCHWRIMEPDHCVLTGTTLHNEDIGPERGQGDKTRPPGAYKAAVANLVRKTYDGDQCAPVCDWIISYRDGRMDDSARLEIWINTDCALLRDSLFLPKDASHVSHPVEFVPVSWKRLGN